MLDKPPNWRTPAQVEARASARASLPRTQDSPP